jgi:hypothetical protein
MSFLLSLDNTSSDYSKIIEIIPRYEKFVQEAEPMFDIEGKRLEEVMRSLPQNQARYDQALQDMKGLEEWLNTVRDRLTAKFWKKYTEHYSRALSTKDIQSYIAGEKEILELNQVTIEVALIKNNLAAIVEALKQMGWMLGHVTKLRVAELQDAIL